MPKNPSPGRFRRRHIRRRPYTPTVHTIHQVLDYLPEDTDLPTIREQLRTIVNDDALWELLEEGRVVGEERRKIGEAIAKKLTTKKKARVAK